LCKSGKEYLNEKKTCKLYNFPVHNFETFGILHTLPSLNYQRSNTCIHVKSICYSQIWQNFGDDEYLCKSGKEYLNALLCKFVVYSLQYSETFDVSHVFLPLTIAELSTLKQVRFFGPPCSNNGLNTLNYSISSKCSDLLRRKEGKITSSLVFQTWRTSPTTPMFLWMDRACYVTSFLLRKQRNVKTQNNHD